LLVVFGSAKLREQVEAAKPFHQKREMAAILRSHSRELQPQSTPRFAMSHNSFDPDLAFFDKKIKAGLCAHGFGLLRQNKHTT